MAPYNLLFFILHVVTTNSEVIPTPPTVTLKHGTLKGSFWQTRENRTIEGYLGIPYAKPPVGDLRFEPPQSVKPWSGEKIANTMPPSCFQPNTGGGSQSEDCLFLNVFTPRAQYCSLLPVMFSIFGGRNLNGAISTYTPEYFLDEDIVLVTVQFRTGLFGYLSTNDEVVPGNMGLKDIRLALRWVRDYIQHFGGDPKKVTLVGHSSGGTTVHALLLFAAEEGLFRAGISQSGSLLMTPNFQPPVLTLRLIQILAKLSNCPCNTSAFVRCLKGKPAIDILQLWDKYQDTTLIGIISTKLFPLPGFVIEPECVKDRIITDNPWKRKVYLPWITGINEFEGLSLVPAAVADRSDILFSLLDTYFEDVFLQYNNYQNSQVDGRRVPAAVRDFYLHSQAISRTTYPQLTLAAGDAVYVYPISRGIKNSNTSTTFVYINEYQGANVLLRPPLPPQDILGADHTTDIFFFFPHPGFTFNYRINSTEDDRISKKLVKLWVDFATNLKPTSGRKEIQWKPYGPNNSYLKITGEKFSMDGPFLPERMNFWQQQPYPNRDEVLEHSYCK